MYRMEDWTVEEVVEALNELKAAKVNVRELEDGFYHWDTVQFVASEQRNDRLEDQAKEKISEIVDTIFKLANEKAGHVV